MSSSSSSGINTTTPNSSNNNNNKRGGGNGRNSSNSGGGRSSSGGGRGGGGSSRGQRGSGHGNGNSNNNTITTTDNNVNNNVSHPSRYNNTRQSRGSSNHYNNNKNRSTSLVETSKEDVESITTTSNVKPSILLRDEDVLIGFMPYLKGNHIDAIKIHEEYQMTQNQNLFLHAARTFLITIQQQQEQVVVASTSTSTTTMTAATTPSHHPSTTTTTTTISTNPISSSVSSNATSSTTTHFLPTTTTSTTTNNNHHSTSHSFLSSSSSTIPSQQQLFPQTNTTSPTVDSNHNNHNHNNNYNMNQSLLLQQQQHISRSIGSTPRDNNNDDDIIIPSQNGLRALLLSDNDPIISVPTHYHNSNNNNNNSINNAFVSNNSSNIWGSIASPITPPRPNTTTSSINSGSSVAPGSTISISSNTNTENNNNNNITPQQPILYDTSSIRTTTPILSTPSQTTTATTPDGITLLTPPTVTNTKQQQQQRDVPPPKRIWTHYIEQPGRIVVNGYTGEDYSIILPYGPKEEVTATYSIPMSYIQEYYSKNDRIPNLVVDPSDASLDKALHGLTIGLFRRGCTENGQQASIISKEVKGFKRYYDHRTNMIHGIVPFFSPRTPGNVLFRMYWENDPIQTLAMGPTLHVRIIEQDFESSIRFLLSNFKGRKSNPTSLSSLHSLATVLETSLVRRHDSTVARSVWGCIQEARKVVDACYQEYIKTCSKLLQIDAKVEELKKQVEEEGEAKAEELKSDNNGDGNSHTEPNESGKSEAELALIEKTRSLLAGRASCERKWRDSQLAFAAILEAVLMNKSMGSLLRRDLIAKMRIEYDLWCPLSEEFAVPIETTETWFECIEDLPQSLTTEHIQTFQQARIKMQMRTLGFDINTMTLEDILFPQAQNNTNSGSQRVMDRNAVNVFNSLSNAMGLYYQELFADEEKVVRQRELIRLRTEKNVQESKAFPPGTQVLIFGSSANGFGSPKSDLDMCLHLPNGATISSTDERGSESMATLAEQFVISGMKEVDTSRLTARIPIIMYKCPDPLAETDADDNLLECDLSMHNPLAVLNTSLLRSYAEITPVTRVLASIIKRWAKARDINSPARHTLSSYGYIIMLLHFLTYHKRTGNGLVSPVANPEGDTNVRDQKVPQATPILPNLLWIDPNWPKSPPGMPYREQLSLPKNTMKHPMKDTFVNTYFYKPNFPNEKAMLQKQFAGDDLSLAILLATFFRYYAYEFDYKRHVVSLHSTASRGIVEREVKAELDGWRNYSAALAIEDPFELDYDVAHVLRGGYYHRIRREFAMAYTKIADAASGRSNAWNKGDLRTMTGKDLIDWICEPISIEREQS